MRPEKGGKPREAPIKPRSKLLSWAYFENGTDAPDVRAIVRLFQDNSTEHEDYLLGLSRDLDCFVPQQRPGETLPGQPYPPLSVPAEWQKSLLERIPLTASDTTEIKKVLQDNFPKYAHLVASMQVKPSWIGRDDLRHYVLGHWWDGTTFVTLPAPLEMFPTTREVHAEDDFPSWYREITSIR